MKLRGQVQANHQVIIMNQIEAMKQGIPEIEVETAWDGSVWEVGYAPAKPDSVKASEVRAERDAMLDGMENRVKRYETQKTAGIPTTDTQDTYYTILYYLQYLRDIPSDPNFPNVTVQNFDTWKVANGYSVIDS